jgi:hypothetical protein
LPLVFSAGLGYSSSALQFEKYQSGEIRGNYEGDVGAINFENFSRLNPSSCVSSADRSDSWLSECEVDVLVIGDSHAQHLLPGFISNFPSLKFGALGVEVHNAESSDLRNAIRKQIEANPYIRIVVFNSYWAKNGVSSNLSWLIKSLTEDGKKVVILDDVPNFPFDAFTCKYGLSAFIKHSNCSTSSKRFLEQNKEYLPQLQNAVRNVQNAELIVTSSQYCSDVKCSMLKEGRLHYLDLNHLNTLGSKYITRFVASNSGVFCMELGDRISSVCEEKD